MAPTADCVCKLRGAARRVHGYLDDAAGRRDTSAGAGVGAGVSSAAPSGTFVSGSYAAWLRGLSGKSQTAMGS